MEGSKLKTETGVGDKDNKGARDIEEVVDGTVSIGHDNQHCIAWQSTSHNGEHTCVHSRTLHTPTMY